MAFKVDDDVLVTAKVLYRDDQNDSQVANLANESGVVKKTDKGYYYVETQFGMHYLKESQLVTDPG